MFLPISTSGELTIIVVITNNDLFNLTKFAHFTPKVLVESIKVVLKLVRVHLIFGIIRRILVEVWEKDGLRVRGLDMFARAAVSVSACADFVVKRTVDLEVIR